MRIGLQLDTLVPFADVTDGIARAAAAGFASAWVNEGHSWDPLTLLAAAGGRAPGIELGTAVVQTYPRNPLALATQALTLQAALGERLVLGIGPSHRWIVEGRYGISWDRPLRQVREFLDALVPVLAGGEADVRGETLTAVGGVTIAGVAAPPVLVAAHGPKMLALAGERADGVITIMTTPELLESYVVPAAGAAGRTPRIVVGVQAAVTADPDAARAALAEKMAFGATMPSYRATLDRQDAGGPADVMLAGDEREVERAVRRFADAGATDLVVHATGTPEEQARTVEVFGGLAVSVR